MTLKYTFIASEEGHHSVVSMCRWAKVSRSGYYAWLNREPSATAQRRDILAAEIRFCFDRSDDTYGYRRIHAQLARWGTMADPETIRTIVRELGLIACQPRPFRPVTTLAGDAADLPDLVRRDFTATAPAAKLVGDITYIRTWEGWLFLATVLDCFSKKVVGCAMADHLRTELVSDALR
ncbi:IS3 family transposase, partial [Nocardia sp. NPDC049190]|uniref:IS3 family transposase n=1 Tax=Nocardia sp. NPDC049190 TaxID=3155650 RepID=UPI0033DAACD8